ncbi:MAG: hypothetical protein KDE51_17745, partial [Anaerolineales bacterium]|nr:hypothetical protein [Anaerolineales bacterium]
MTKSEILDEFKQLSIRQQLETLRAALEIVEASFEASQQDQREQSPSEGKADSLLALAGILEAPVSDIAEKHDQYIGEDI